MSENTQVALLLVGLLLLYPVTVGMFLWMYREQARDWQKERQLLLTRIQAPEQGIALAHMAPVEVAEETVSGHFGPFPDLTTGLDN